MSNVMKKADVEKRILELRSEINYHSDLYYNKNISEISDYEFDVLMNELKSLEEKYPEFIVADSPTQKVGGDVQKGFEKMEHSTPTISLRDVFSKEEVYSFMESLRKSFGQDVEVVVEKKIDGLTIRSIYEDGKYKDALTRGDGVFGEKVSKNVEKILDVPMKTKDNLQRLEVRGEAYMTYKTFEEVNDLQSSRGEKTYKNPRNLASGTLRQLDPKIVEERKLNMFVFNVEVADVHFDTHSESLEWLEEQGFVVTPGYKVCTTADEVWEEICKIGESRENLEYPIDGAVVKVNRLDYREELGSTSKTPRWAIAFKYPPEEKETVLEKFFLSQGKSRVTPVGIIKPVKLEGTTVEKVTLHNFDFIEEKGIRFVETEEKGVYKVLNGACKVRKAGSIIPELVCMLGKKGDIFDSVHVNPIPTKCPVCDGDLAKDGVSNLVCTNEFCKGKIARRIEFFASREAMDISGCGKSTVEALLENGYIEGIADLYTLKEKREELIASGIIGRQKSVDNLIAAIEKSKTNDLDKLITGFGIRNVGKRASKELAKKFKNMDELVNATYEELISLPEFGDVMVSDILKFMSSDVCKELLGKLVAAGVNMESNVLSNRVDSRFEGLTFVLTGTLPTLKRDKCKEIIESYGGKVSSSVSKKTHYVLAGEEAGSKLDKAYEIRKKMLEKGVKEGERVIKIIDEKKFKSMIE